MVVAFVNVKDLSLPKSVSVVVTISKTRYIISDSSGAWDVHHMATRDIGPLCSASWEEVERVRERNHGEMA